MNVEVKVRLLKLAGLMRVARSQFDKAGDVFTYLCELHDWYHTECINRDYILEDIMDTIGGLGFLMFDKDNGFDGRQFRDCLWSYDTIELYAHECLAPDQIDRYMNHKRFKKLDIDHCIQEISKGV